MLGTLRELYLHRELALVLAWREIVVRYKRSVLGVGWALAEPLFLVLVYTVVFDRFLGAGRGLANYSLFAFMGVLAWTFFAATLEQCTTAMSAHAPLLRKTYFPREILILAIVVSRFSTLALGSLIGVTVAGAFVAASDSVVWQRLPFVLVGLASIAVIATGIGLFVSAAQVILRDVEFLVRFALRLAFYACPIVYPVLRVPDALRGYYDLNPFVGLLWLFQGFTDAQLAPPTTTAVMSSATAVLLTPLAGWYLFRHLQWRVADLL